MYGVDFFIASTVFCEMQLLINATLNIELYGRYAVSNSQNIWIVFGLYCTELYVIIDVSLIFFESYP